MSIDSRPNKVSLRSKKLMAAAVSLVLTFGVLSVPTAYANQANDVLGIGQETSDKVAGSFDTIKKIKFLEVNKKDTSDDNKADDAKGDTSDLAEPKKREVLPAVNFDALVKENKEAKAKEQKEDAKKAETKKQESAPAAQEKASTATTTPAEQAPVSDEQSYIDKWAPRIDAYLSGSPLAGHGETFARAAYNNGVDPRLSPAISNVESSKGRHCFKSHNAWGWGSSSWGSWESAIEGHVSGIKRVYGSTITSDDAKRYCPVNPNWYSSVQSEMNKI